MKQASPVRYYGLAILLVATATLLMGLITWSGYFSPTFALFYLAVLLSAWYGGPYPGLTATALSALAGAYFFMQPTFSLQLDMAGVLKTGLFIGVALLLSVFISTRRRAEEDLDQARRRLEESYALLDSIYASAPVGLGFFDRELRFVRLNQHLAEMNGLPVAEHLGKTPAQLLPGLKDIDQAMASLHQILETGWEMVEVEVQGETPAQPGVTRYWLESWYPVRVKDQVIGVGMVVEEVTEQKQLAQVLAEQEKQYRRIVETANEGIWTIDSQEKTDYINARGAEILGYTPAEMLGRSPLDFIYPENTQDLKEMLALHRQNAAQTREFRMRRKDGPERWISYTTTPVFDEQELYAGSLAMFNDITDRRQAELELHRARQAAEQSARRLARLQSVTAALSQALTPAEVAQVIVEEAIQATETHGGIIYRVEQWEDGPWLETVRAVNYPAQVLERYNRFPLAANLPAAEAVRSGQPLWFGSYEELIHRYPHLAASPRTNQNQAFAIIPLQIEQHILGAVVWSFDRPQEFDPDEQAFFLTLTGQCAQALERAQLYERAQQARVEAEAEINIRRQTEEQLKVSLQEKQALLREVNHRIKNNLQAVSNLLSLQAYTIADPEARIKFGETQDRIKSIAMLHEKLYQTQDFTHLNFAEYVTDLARHLIHSYKANPNLVRLEADCQEISLKVDTAVSLGIITNELISNVLKHAFTPEQEGVLGITLRRDAGDHLHLEVWDNGKGLPAGYNLFESRTLGLQLVQTLAGYMKGQVTLEDGPGTRIRLTFPLLD